MPRRAKIKSVIKGADVLDCRQRYGEAVEEVGTSHGERFTFMIPWSATTQHSQPQLDETAIEGHVPRPWSQSTSRW